MSLERVKSAIAENTSDRYKVPWEIRSVVKDEASYHLICTQPLLVGFRSSEAEAHSVRWTNWRVEPKKGTQ
jgi:hypothetical protein